MRKVMLSLLCGAMLQAQDILDIEKFSFDHTSSGASNVTVEIAGGVPPYRYILEGVAEVNSYDTSVEFRNVTIEPDILTDLNIYDSSGERRSLWFNGRPTMDIAIDFTLLDGGKNTSSVQAIVRDTTVRDAVIYEIAKHKGGATWVPYLQNNTGYFSNLPVSSKPYLLSIILVDKETNKKTSVYGQFFGGAEH